MNRICNSTDGLSYYKRLSNKYLDTEGDKINSLEYWYQYIYKYDIMNEVAMFKNELRNMTKSTWYRKNNVYIGMYPRPVITPIIKFELMERIETIYDLIKEFELNVTGKRGGKGSIPDILKGTIIGNAILKELKETHYSENVFCHNNLYYKNFIIKENKLIGIDHWECSGFYPPEFEDIIQRYLEFI
ncbi:unnamed protein product [Cunninghamella echinulata]